MAPALLEEVEQVSPAVAPGVELDLTDAGSVVHCDLAAAEALLPGLYLDLLGKWHTIRDDIQLGPYLATEDPHARLGVLELHGEEDVHGLHQHPVPDTMSPGHGLGLELGQAVAADEVQLVPDEDVRQLLGHLGGVGGVAVEGDDDILVAGVEARLVGPAVTLPGLLDYLGTLLLGDLSGPVGGVVHDGHRDVVPLGDLVDGLAYRLLLVHGGDDDVDGGLICQGTTSRKTGNVADVF